MGKKQLIKMGLNLTRCTFKDTDLVTMKPFKKNAVKRKILIKCTPYKCFFNVCFFFVNNVYLNEGSPLFTAYCTYMTVHVSVENEKR